jgi:thiamine pyrophosphokinase
VAYPLHPGTVALEAPVGSRLSIVPLTALDALSIKGVRWPLHRRDVAAGSTLTLSNEVVEPQVTVSLEKGEGLLLVYPVLSIQP